LALVAQQQPVYHPQNQPTHYTQNSSTIPQQAATKNKGIAIVNSPPPTYELEPKMVAEDDALSKEKEIDKLIALISQSFNKIYKPTNNNIRTSSNTSKANQDNTLRINRGTGYDNQRAFNAAEARENVEQADWRDDTNDKLEDQEFEAHYLYMAQIQEVTLDAANNSGPIFDAEPLQKVQNDDDNYNVFANYKEHPQQPESVNVTYPDEQGDTNITTDSLDMSNNRGHVEQDENEDLAREQANTKQAKTKQLMFKHLKKFQAGLDRYHDVNYASKVEIKCAKVVMDIQEKDKNQSQNDKTKHENGKTMRSKKDKVKVNKSQKVKVNPGMRH
ncbi:hypothetical protein Tco_1459967, partial [Tanacetum coccineum]